MYNGADGLPATECLKKVEGAVTGFLKTVRKNNPQAYILWAYGMMGTVVESAVKSGIAAYCEETGDTSVRYIALEEITGEQIGARFHPGIYGHKRTAEQICHVISELRKEA